MKILHITPSSDGYEEVTLLANRHSKNNQLAVIEKDGEVFMTGGYLIQDTPSNRAFLDSIPKNEQYQKVHEFKQDPWVKFYYLEAETKAPMPEVAQDEYLQATSKTKKSWFSKLFS